MPSAALPRHVPLAPPPLDFTQARLRLRGPGTDTGALNGLLTVIPSPAVAIDATGTVVATNEGASGCAAQFAGLTENGTIPAGWAASTIWNSMHGRVRIVVMQKPPRLEEESPAAFRARARALGLAPRLADVVYQTCRGASLKEAAVACSITPSTARTYLQIAYRSLDVHNRMGLLHALGYPVSPSR